MTNLVKIFDKIRSGWPLGWLIQRIDGATDTTLLVLHHVHGEGARLVREHVLNLAELLVEVGGARQRVGINTKTLTEKVSF